MFTLFAYTFLAVWVAGTTLHQEDRLDRLEGRVDTVWQDLIFVDYDHRVDLCQLRHAEDSALREQCVIQAYRRYCETSKQCSRR